MATMNYQLSRQQSDLLVTFVGVSRYIRTHECKLKIYRKQYEILCLGRHIMPLFPAVFAVVSTHQSSR
jgi:hypothetical protein